jgi:hypothetical protein
MSIGKQSWRSKFSLIALFTAVFLLVAFLVTYEGCDRRCSDWDFEEDLLLNDPEYPKVRRWAHNPSILVKVGHAAEIDMVRGAVYELNQILSRTDMKVRFTQDGLADITVTFLSKEKFDNFRRQRKVDLLIQGLCQTSSSKGGQLKGARIFVRRNLSEGDKWGTVLHELGHAMGISNHSDRYISSLFYVNFKGGGFSDRYSEDDRKLLEFLYRHVRAGADEAVVRSAFESHWSEREQ